ncbi:hypothetical protein AN1V17_32420 [Vallitalea sediminicola]
MHQTKVIKTIVCGVGFGQFYLEALQLIQDEVEIIGILSNGSEKSKDCAKYYGVDLYTDIDDVPSDIDLACIAVKSEIMGGQGVDLAIDFLERNRNVILEHPVCYKNIAKCMKTARQHNVFFKVGDLYTNLPSVKKYMDCTIELFKIQTPQYIEIQCSTRVLFPMVHILSKLLPSISPIKVVNCTKGLGIYQIISGTIGKIPFLLKANNELNINEPDSYIREFHRFSIDVQGGRLTLTDTHGPTIWQPILKLPTLNIEPKDRFTKYTRELLSESTQIIGDEKVPSYDVILSKMWPKAIADDIQDIRRMILGESEKKYDLCNMQQMILYAKQWQQLTKELGYPELNDQSSDEWVDPYIFENTISESRNRVTEKNIINYIDSLDEASIISMLYTLQSYKALLPNVHYTEEDILALIKMSSKYKKVIKRWLRVLCDKKYVDVVNGKYIYRSNRITKNDMDNYWKNVNYVSSDKICPKLVVDYFESNANNLSEFLNDEVNPTFLLFPQGRMDYANALYSETIIAKYLNGEIAKKVTEIMDEKKDTNNILEVGAGTGATSRVVLEEISKRNNNNFCYQYTDISNYFISNAKKYFSDYCNIDYQVIDIDMDLEEQGINIESKDIIIANGVLNNVRNMNYTLNNFYKTLIKGGFLLIIEPTKEFVEMLISQVFMMESPNDDRNNTKTTFLTVKQWENILEENRFLIQDVLPEVDNILKHFGQNLFIVKKEIMDLL